MTLSAREKSNITRWNGRQAPFYEVYYLTWNDPAQGVGGWIRYTLLSSVKKPPEASVWAFVFDAKDPSRNAGIKKTFPIQDVRIERDLFYFGAGASAIFDDGCRGHIGGDTAEALWEIRFEEKGDPLYAFPRLFYKTAFPKSKFIAPYLATKISGEFSWNDRKIVLDNVAAHQGHIWGIEHAESWIWAHANTFAEDPSFCFDGLSARVRIGDKLSPPLTVLFFRWEDKLYTCNSPLQWFTNRSLYVFDQRQGRVEGKAPAAPPVEGATRAPIIDRWHFETTADDVMFVGDYQTRFEHMVAARYEDPTGSERFSHHTELANVRIQILKKSKAGWETVKILNARDSAAFETVRPTHDPRVRLLLP